MNPYPTFQNQQPVLSYPANDALYQQNQDLYKQQNPNPYQQNPNPYQQNPNPYQQNPNPYQQNPNPYQQNPNPYQQNPNPYQQNPNPYQQNYPVQQNNYNPYAQSNPLYQPYPNSNTVEVRTDYTKMQQNNYQQHQNYYAPQNQQNMPVPAPLNQYAKPTATQNDETKAIKYIIHKIEFHDTLDGLSLQYNVSAREIKIFNGLTTDDIYYMKEIKIPNPDLDNLHETTVEFDEAALRKQQKLKAMRGLMEKDDHKAAQFYLDENNWEVDIAYQNYKQDLEFEKRYQNQSDQAKHQQKINKKIR